MTKKPTTATKKQTTASKKPTATKKKPTTASKKPTAAKKKTTTAPKKPTTAQGRLKSTGLTAAAELNQARKPIDFTNAPPDIQALVETHEPHINLLPPHYMAMLLEDVQSLMNDFRAVSENNLTATQRRRKFGAGIRNYGFIEKVADLANANPQFATFFDVADLQNAIKNVDMCRDVVVAPVARG